MDQTPTETRIIVIGDEIVAGAGDPKGLGWVGRVVAHSGTQIPVTAYHLAVPNETTSGLSARWEHEVRLRLEGEAGIPSFEGGSVDYRLVVALGRADAATDVSVARSRLNLANILDVTAAMKLPTFVAGPPPGLPQHGARLAQLAAAFGEVAGRRRVPYVDLYTPLARHEQWLDDLSANGSALPGQAGHGLIAWLVLHGGWRPWLGIDEQ